MIFIQERIGKLTRELCNLIYKESIALTNYRNIIVEEPIEITKQLDTKNWDDFGYAMNCGGKDEYYYFTTDITTPDNYDGKTIVFKLDAGGGSKWDSTNPQCRCYVNGVFVQGLDENHESIILSECGNAGETFQIVLRVYTGTHSFQTVLKSSIAMLDRKTEKYYYDVLVPYQVACLLGEDEKEYIDIITSLNESLNLLDFRKAGSNAYYASLEQAQKYLEIEFYEKWCGNSKSEVYCIGHTHIDIAWLWTLEVAKDKAARSFSTVLELMKEYPEYKFMSSQPHLYQAMKEREPQIYTEIKKRIEEGRWEADGGMYVEADCNLSSGEALVRQILFGKRFFQEEFQVDNEILWLPDVFGYSAALPQIMKKSGLPYFMTTKISWNEFNKLPYDTFLWEGIDGSKVLTHFIPASDYDKEMVKKTHYTTYNGFLEASQIKGSWQRYQQKHLNEEVLMAFGYGDGGGGPTKEMLEHQRRLSRGIPGSPKTVMSTAKDFFHVLDNKVSNSKYLPEWSGELYLEYHRGTYTSMARNKKYNRKSEFLLQNVECFSTMNQMLVKEEYPQSEINAGWEILLRNQFHDILPGSSIKEVYETSREEYLELISKETSILTDSLNQLTHKINAPKSSVVIFNPNGFVANDLVEFQVPSDSTDLVITDGTEQYAYQKTKDNHIVIYAKQIPAKGFKTFYLKEEEQIVQISLNVTTELMENDFYCLKLNKKGQFSSIFDKTAGREVLQPGTCGNVIMTYEDKPHNWDAWDLNNYYVEKSWEVDDLQSIEVVEQGELRACLKIVRNYLDSVITQFIYIYKDIPRIDIKNVIDWKEHHIFMKALFPVDIHTSEATFDIQYGNVKRATHYNTSWDYARFEVCHHKWLDVSEDNYGVSLLNDCKYGCNIHNGIIGLSLLKSATSPNPDADNEIHEFTYSLYPHTGDWKAAGTVHQAYVLNNPLMAVVKNNEGGSLPEQYSMVSVDAENVMIEVVKKAEASNSTIIRVYECFNRRTNVTMKFANQVDHIEECDLLEKEIGQVDADNTSAEFTILPYEIKTFRVTWKEM